MSTRADPFDPAPVVPPSNGSDPFESFEAATPISTPPADAAVNGHKSPLGQLNEPLERTAAISAIGGRILPHSPESEIQLLTACIAVDDNGAAFDRAVKAGIKPSSFYEPRHATIFATLVRMFSQRIPLETYTLGQELTKAGQLAEIGGTDFIVKISSSFPDTQSANYAIERVRSTAMVREVIRAATLIVEEGYQSATSDAETFARDAQRRISAPILLADPTLETADWPELVTAANLCSAPPPTPPTLIDGMLYRGGTMLLSGPSKSHKTFTMLDAAVAISDGRPWLGFKTAPTPVLYLNLELQHFATASRLQGICQARGTEMPANLHLWNLRGKSVSINQLASKLPKKIRETKAGIVIVDPHYKISSVSGMEENSNDDQGNLLSQLEGLCTAEGSSLMLSHHFAKGDASTKNAIDRASGGGVFARWGDVMLTFTPHDKDDAMTVEMSLRNFAPVEPFVVTWEYPRWQRDDDLDPKDLKSSRGPKERHTAQDALHALGNETLGFAEWEKKTGMPKSTFKRKRQELLESGDVVQMGNFYKKAN